MIQLTNDRSRAIFSLGLGYHVSMLLQYVLELSSGGSPCPIEGASLGMLWGVHRNRVNEARRWLVAARILDVIEGGYVMNWRFAEWVEPDGCTPLLSAEILAYAVAGVETESCFNGQHAVKRKTVSNGALKQETVSALKQESVSISAMKQETVSCSPVIERTLAQARARELNSIQSNSIQRQAGGIAEVVSREETQPAAPVARPMGIVSTREQDDSSPGSPVPAGGKGSGGAHDPALLEAGREIRRAFGAEAAAMLWGEREQIAEAIGGRWDCYVAAIHDAEAYRAKPGSEPIRNLGGFLIGYANGWIKDLAGGRSLPISVNPKPAEPLYPSQRVHVEYAPTPTAEQMAEYRRCNAIRKAENIAKEAARVAKANARGITYANTNMLDPAGHGVHSPGEPLNLPCLRGRTV